MQKENNKKRCEICNKQIPDDYGNALCDDCYIKQTKENEQKKKEEQDELEATGRDPIKRAKLDGEPNNPLKGITDPEYTKNPVQEEISQVTRNYTQYKKSGKWIWTPTRTMYEFIRDSFIDIVKNHPQYPKFVWKPTVIDIGCGSGLGANILSQEADFVWGVDKSVESVHFANEVFKRNKNFIYYTPELRYDVVDVANPQPNIEMKFDVLVAIEIFEHLEDYEDLFKFMKMVMKPTSMAWISTPNRNNKAISNEKPKNKYHVIEMTQEEFVEALSKYFNKVTLFNSAGEPVGDNNTHTPLLALCQEPK